MNIKTGLVHIAAAVAAACMLATPASATVVTLQVVGQDLRVLASGLGGATVVAWDVDIAFNALITGSILGVNTAGQLGQTNVDTIFGSVTTPGLLDIFEVSLLTNAQVDALQTADPITLATVHFNATADLSTGNFTLVNWGPTNQVVCAVPGTNDVTVCFQGTAATVPEPTSLALSALALAGCCMVGQRRLRRAMKRGEAPQRPASIAGHCRDHRRSRNAQRRR